VPNLVQYEGPHSRFSQQGTSDSIQQSLGQSILWPTRGTKTKKTWSLQT